MPTILARAKQITGSSDPGPSPAPAPAAGIKKIQQALADLGYLDTTKWLIDGVLGDATRTAVRTYQHDAGLVTDGDPGPITTTALEADMATVKTLATDSQKLKAATERNERRLEDILEQLAAVAGAVTDLVAEIRTADLVKGRERIEQNNAVLSQLDPRNPKNQKGA
jgi:peptidoglycan hydrolase-like protein with peptidoglycan-binding domain